MDVPSIRVRIWFLLIVILGFGTLSHAATFKNPSFIETSYDPFGLAAADFSNDGNLDLVYIDGTSLSTFHVLLGNGNGTFTHGQDIALPTGICGYAGCVINIADVTADGNLDVILGGAGTTIAQIAVLVSNGNGTFQQPVVSTFGSPNGTYPSLNAIMGVGDLNGDGAGDLVIPDRLGAKVYVVLGNNTGTFSLKSSSTFYFTGQANAHVLDFNGDGKLDAVILDPPPGGQTFVMFGNGDGTFKPFINYNTLASLFVDVDGDGQPDLLTNFYLGQIQFLKGNPNGTFGTAVTIATIPTNSFLIATGEFNSDGNLDLLLSNPAGIATALGKGNLSYGTPASSIAGRTAALFFSAGDMTQGDFNNDGHSDIAIGVEGGIALLLGTGNGTFLSADLYDVGQLAGATTIADFNSDNFPDIAVTVPASYPRLLLGNGSGAFSLGPDQNQSYGTQNPSGTNTLADFNGDGKKDVSVLTPTTSFPYGQTFVLFGVGNGTFGSPVPISGGVSLVGDVNNDGRSDLVFNDSSGNVQALLGQLNGTFIQVLTPLRFGGNVTAIGDVNKDAKPDLILTGFTDFEVWLGAGNGSFSFLNNFPIPPEIGVQTAAIIDLDGDGNRDFIVAPYPNFLNSSAALVLFYGNGDGTFQVPVMLPISHAYGSLVVADVNADGKPDLVLTDGIGIAVIRNLGGRIFGQEEHYTGGQAVGGISVADVNGDGFPDIVAANPGGTTVAVLLNQPNGSSSQGPSPLGAFSVTPEPSNYSQPVTLSITLSAPPGSGLPTPTGSVNFNVDGAFISTASLALGSASYVDTSILAAGTHTFLVSYNGDSTYSAASFALIHTVQPPVYTTHTALTATPTTVLTSQTVRLTATVTSSVPVNVGIVTFLDGTSTIGSQTVDSKGVARLDTAILKAGKHVITGVYQGYTISIGTPEIFTSSTSAAVNVTVNSTSTTTTASAQNTSGTAGTVFTFTAQVSSGSGVPFGAVAFYDGSVVLGTTSLLNGSTTFSTASLAAGTHSISAAFLANATYGSSTSQVINVAISAVPPGLAPTAVSIAAQNSSTLPGSSQLSARVTAVDGIAQGVVTFIDTGVVLGSASVDASGNAVLDGLTFGGGEHNFSASFAGSAAFAPSSSPELYEVWPAIGSADFSFTTVVRTTEIANGVSLPVLLTVTAGSGFGGNVVFECDSVRPGYECTFSPPSITGGGSVYLTIGARRVAASTGKSWPELSIVLFALVFMDTTARQRIRLARIVRLLAIALAMSLLAACGNTASTQKATQLSVVSVRASAGAGSTAISHSIQMVVESVQ